ncbi:SusC/RagA family TonB-linked outer membrane protein [Rhodothermus profundi]|uniref:Iron complex outermembrane recepter protein n=1 Tax=Rhodothermus profundi TaxID=633813 RepID=A0A1M6WCN0_9BACT|nr:TonB-dependent receptor [Rhodothermus profundi]SHK91477.1 iron complex outermembrane recepter protein [Rhodothermus profundi]
MRTLLPRSLWLGILLGFWSVSVAIGQPRTVTGTVTDASTGEPLPGVNIVVLGTMTGTTTDVEGRYQIEVPGPEAVLVFSFVGYEQVQEVVGDRAVINVRMQPTVEVLEEIVVVGYGVQRREDVTGSVATINADDVNQGNYISPDQLLQGRVAGLTIFANNGEPGAGLNIRLRGGTSISASNEPLIVIDGVPIDNVPLMPQGAGINGAPPPPRNPLSLINPNDIESITVLKDAAATAIYGSRGANGVILIETKKGRQGQLQVDYDAYITAASPYKKMDVLNGEEYRRFVEEQIQAGNLPPSARDVLGNANTDWEEAVMRTAITQFHNLAFSGGTSQTRYRASVSYLNQQGQVIDSGLERLTGRLNADHQAFDGRLRLQLNLTGSFQYDDLLPYNQTAGFEGGVLSNVFQMNPTYPIYSETNLDGTPATDGYFEIADGRTSVRNPVAMAEQVEDIAKTTRALGNIAAELDLLPGLTAKVNFGADRAQSSRRQYFPQQSPVGSEFGGRALLRSREHSSLTFQSYLTYRNTFAQAHNVELLGGYEFNEYMTEEFGVEGRDYVTDATSYNAVQAGAQLVKEGTFSFKEKSRLVSFFTRLNYNYQNKYYLTAVLRYDGSSRFGEGNKWALFPAISGAWRLSAEPFMQGLEWLTDLRLKIGYGITGSQEIGNYLSLAQLGARQDLQAVFNQTAYTGFAPINYANPDLKWEETSTFNIGLDYELLNGKFSGTIEYYVKNTSNLLLEIPVPQPAPVPTRIENIGKTRNRGFELSLDALAVDRPNLSVLFGLVFSTNRNEVVSLGPHDFIVTGIVSGRGQSGTFAQRLIPGEPVGTFYGWIFEGVDANGRQQFRDLNGDGQITDADRTIIGNAQPDFTYGFRTNIYWGNFDINIFIRGEQGRDVFNNTALVYQTKSAVLQNQNFLKAALDDPDALDEPAIYSSRWIEDGSFIRLDNVTIGYTFNNLGGVWGRYVRRARIYVTGQNLLVITPYSGYDPEVNINAGLASLGIDYAQYPRARSFTLGISLGF